MEQERPGSCPAADPSGPAERLARRAAPHEASATCGAGHGDRIAPGGASWATLTLHPGRYELICNLPGHYATGMHTELDVR